MERFGKLWKGVLAMSALKSGLFWPRAGPLAYFYARQCLSKRRNGAQNQADDKRDRKPLKNKRPAAKLALKRR
jgi:hypothetical protein